MKPLWNEPGSPSASQKFWGRWPRETREQRRIWRRKGHPPQPAPLPLWIVLTMGLLLSLALVGVLIGILVYDWRASIVFGIGLLLLCAVYAIRKFMGHSGTQSASQDKEHPNYEHEQSRLQ
jgi:hypothetical protein